VVINNLFHLGSMKKYLDEVRLKLTETCTKLLADIPQIKIGVMAVGMYILFSERLKIGAFFNYYYYFFFSRL
jgi:hypothetical protein